MAAAVKKIATRATAIAFMIGLLIINLNYESLRIQQYSLFIKLPINVDNSNLIGLFCENGKDMMCIIIIKMKVQSNSKLLQTNGITALAFSHNFDFCVIATKKDINAHLFRVGNLANIESWQKVQKFHEHSQTISDVDWSSDYKVITCSHDRSIVVWQRVSDNKWEKMLVNVDAKLSILVSKWAPSNSKFAIGSSCNTLALGFYSKEEKTWASENNNSISKSPITSISFHPSSNIIAVGYSDFSLKIVTTSFKKSKKQHIIALNIEANNNYNGPFSKVDSLFEVLFTTENMGGWINFVSFQNAGSSLIVLPHTNHIKIYDIAENEKIVVGEEDIRWNGLPFLSGYITKNKELILAGYDKKIARFAKKGNYVFEKFLTDNQKTGAQKTKKGLVAGLTKGIEKKQSLFGESPKETEHLNTIRVLQVKQSPYSYDINGIVHIWN